MWYLGAVVMGGWSCVSGVVRSWVLFGLQNRVVKGAAERCRGVDMFLWRSNPLFWGVLIDLPTKFTHNVCI